MADVEIEETFELTLRLNKEEAEGLWELLNVGVNYQTLIALKIYDVFSQMDQTNKFDSGAGRTFKSQAMVA